jgi:membrane protein implicated in regulation of membrane protease activity
METFFIICFAMGLVLSLLSVAGGFGHFHIGHFHVGNHIGHAHGPHGAGHNGGISAVNAFTVLAFLTWFGGAGYLLHRATIFSEPMVFVLAAISGFAGAGLLWAALFKVLLPHERVMDVADTEMAGVVARVSNGIRGGDGIGEIIFSQTGARRASAARSDDGHAIERGTEVVVIRYERGVAYVRRWDELPS